MSPRNLDFLLRTYRKTFPPNGIVFEDVKEYASGDNIRLMNWNASAKTGRLLVNRTRLDSGPDVIFAVDISKSMHFGTQKQSKVALATDIVKTLSALALKNKDKVGLIAFSDTILKYMPPKLSNAALAKIIENEVLRLNNKQTNLAATLRTMGKIIKKRSMIIIICDVFALSRNRKSVLTQLHILAARHKLIVLPISDRHDMLRDNIGTMIVKDAETGNVFEVNTNNPMLMQRIKTKFSAYKNLIFKEIKNIGAELLEGSTSKSGRSFLVEFFSKIR